jgi:hypothetical protein
VLAVHLLFSQNVQISLVLERRCVFNTVYFELWTAGCPVLTVELFCGFISETLVSHDVRSTFSGCCSLVKTVSHCYKDSILHIVIRTFSFSSCIYFWCPALQFIQWALRTLFPRVKVNNVGLCIDSSMYIQSMHTTFPLLLYIFLFIV